MISRYTELTEAYTDLDAQNDNKIYASLAIMKTYLENLKNLSVRIQFDTSSKTSYDAKPGLDIYGNFNVVGLHKSTEHTDVLPEEYRAEFEHAVAGIELVASQLGAELGHSK